MKLQGFDVRFPLVEANGQTRNAAQRIDSSLEVNCWTTTMSDAVSLEWDRDLNKPGRPHTTRAHTSLTDFLVWTFRPLPLKAQLARHFRERKRLLEITAARLVTYIALAFEMQILPAAFQFADRLLDAEMDSDEEIIDLKGMYKTRKRLRRGFANMVVEKASRLLYSGEEPWGCD